MPKNHCFSAYREKINMFRLRGVGYIRACPNFAMIFSRIKSAFLSINFRVRERNIFPTPQNIFVQDSFAFYRNKQRVMRSETRPADSIWHMSIKFVALGFSSSPALFEWTIWKGRKIVERNCNCVKKEQIMVNLNLSLVKFFPLCLGY